MKVIKKYKKIIVIAALTILVVGVVTIIFFHRKASQNIVSIKSVDTSIGQYSDRTNIVSPVVTPVVSTKEGVAVAQQTPAVPLASTCTLLYTLQPNVSSVRNGDDITYSVSIKNNSVQNCEDVSLSLYYSENETFVSSSLKPSASSNYYWNIGEMTSAQEKNFTVTTQATQNDSTSIHTDSCASADGAADACDASDIIISGVDTPIASVPTISSSSTQTSTPIPVPSGNTSTINNGSKTYGVWVWVSPIQMSTAYMDSIMTAAKANQFNTVYLTIDDYLDILALPNGATKTAQETSYSAALEKFVSLAHTNGISVYAEAGSRDWSEDPTSGSDHRCSCSSVKAMVLLYRLTAICIDLTPLGLSILFMTAVEPGLEPR
jgi:uncharacterized repeat protein (TIGR01451 family)